MIGRACDEVRAGYRKHAVGSHTRCMDRIAGVERLNAGADFHQRMDVYGRLE